MMQAMGQGPDVSVFIGLLIAVSIVAAIVRFVRFPYTVALVLTGVALALAPNAPHVQLTPNIILTIFLPVLLFHGAYNLDLADLRANLASVALLAVPGVAATAALVGLALHAATGLPWSEALLFGAIVGATDPVAVLAIFSEIGAPRRLATIVSAESLFNDGTALVLYATILGVISSGVFDAAATAQNFVVEVAGSLALGAAVAVVGSSVITRLDDALLETTLTLIVAYGGYLLADHLGISGPLETATAGLLLGARGTRIMSPTTRLQARATWEFLDFLANSLLFLLMGLQLHSIGASLMGRLGTEILWPLIVALLAVTIARAIVVAIVSAVLKRVLHHPLPRGWPTVLTWAGLRGAVSLAAGLSLPGGLAHRDELLGLIFGVVLVTLVGQGLTVRIVMTRLGLIVEEASRRDFELALGRLRSSEAAIREIQLLRRDAVIDTHLGERLADELTRQQQELRQRVEEIYHDSGSLEHQQELEVRRRLLQVQREAVRDSYVRGLLSQSAQRELIVSLDTELARLEPILDDES